MATNFPTSLDSFTNPSAADALDSVSVPHADQHANLNDAMEAVQAKLGVGAGTVHDVPRVLVYRATSQSLTSLTYNTISFDTEVYDTHAMHSTSVNTSRLTVPTGWGGYYLVTASGVVNGGTLSITFTVNTTRLIYAGQLGTVGGGSALLNVNAGDYIEWSGYSNSATLLYGNSAVGGYSPSYSAVWIAPS